MLLKVRLLVLGLLSVMAFGAVASTALAEPGPFWHHRAEGGKGEGEKISKQEPEKFSGKSSLTEFISKVGGEEFRLIGEVESEGEIWNEANQGQGKAKLVFLNVKDPAKPSCVVAVTVTEPVAIHLMWKYAGNPKELTENPQLQQKWDGFVIPIKTELSAKGVSGNNSFANVAFSGGEKACGLLNAIKHDAVGSVAFAGYQKLEEFSKEAQIVFPSQNLWQHFWWEGAFHEIKSELLFGTEPAKFAGNLNLKFAKQEVAVFEK